MLDSDIEIWLKLRSSSKYGTKRPWEMWFVRFSSRKYTKSCKNNRMIISPSIMRGRKLRGKIKASGTHFWERLDVPKQPED